MSRLCIHQNEEGFCACVDGKMNPCRIHFTCIDYAPQKQEDALRARIGELEDALDSICRIADMMPHHWNFAKEVNASCAKALKGTKK